MTANEMLIGVRSNSIFDSEAGIPESQNFVIQVMMQRETDGNPVFEVKQLLQEIFEGACTVSKDYQTTDLSNAKTFTFAHKKGFEGDQTKDFHHVTVTRTLDVEFPLYFSLFKTEVDVVQKIDAQKFQKKKSSALKWVLPASCSNCDFSDWETYPAVRPILIKEPYLNKSQNSLLLEWEAL